MPAPPADKRADYTHFLSIATRWMDNDVYGHVNNVVYYSYFDTVINRYLVDEGGLDIAGGAVIGLSVESHCQYREPIAFPEVIDAGLRVAHLGHSSVRYEIAVFRRDAESAAAQGWFVHVFVNRETRKPLEMPERIRTALSRLLRT